MYHRGLRIRALHVSLYAFTFGTARSTHALYQREGTTASPSDNECMYVCTPHTCHVVLYECES